MVRATFSKRVRARPENPNRCIAASSARRPPAGRKRRLQLVVGPLSHWCIRERADTDAVGIYLAGRSTTADSISGRGVRKLLLLGNCSGECPVQFAS